MRALDARAQAEGGIAGAVLMARAAAAAWQELRAQWPAAKTIVVLAGPGNNGGDGYVLATLARQAGYSVQVLHFGPLPTQGDAAAAQASFVAGGGQPRPFDSDALAGVGGGAVIVDAVFGIGLKRALSAAAADAVLAVQQARARGAGVLAMDIPSGLDADTGAALGAVFKADVTVTFIARKLGLFTGTGPEFSGRVVLADLQVPEEVLAIKAAAGALMHSRDLALALPPRLRDAHKGRSGHVLIVGGDQGMAGAVLLAARAALRAGAGLVTVATRAAHAASLVAAQPEVMIRGVESAAELLALAAMATAIAIGPGLGTGDWGREMFAALADRAGLLMDADALNLLAENPGQQTSRILTPHPGEAARLLGLSTAEVQANRPAAVRALAARYGGVAVLKGAGTLVYSEAEGLSVCPYGNPGMAVAGMGDALTGVMAAMLAQGLPAHAAACAGVLAHALAGDLAAEGGERGLLPSDLIDRLRQVVNAAAA